MQRSHELDREIIEEIKRAYISLGGHLIYFPLHGKPEQYYALLAELGAGSSTLGAVGSWGDTLEDKDVLELLRTVSLQR